MDITTSETDTTEVQKLQDALEVQPVSCKWSFRCNNYYSTVKLNAVYSLSFWGLYLTLVVQMGLGVMYKYTHLKGIIQARLI